MKITSKILNPKNMKKKKTYKDFYYIFNEDSLGITGLIGCRKNKGSAGRNCPILICQIVVPTNVTERLLKLKKEKNHDYILLSSSAYLTRTTLT